MSSQISEDSVVQQIISAAERLLRDESEANFTMDQLAQECGISRATLYRQIGSREALLQRMVEDHGLSIDGIDSPGMHERIIQATRAALGKTGSVNFTIEQVASEAGIGVATVYRHFGNKENLLQTFAQQIHPRQAALDLRQYASGDLKQDIYSFVESALKFLYEFHDLAPIYLSGDIKTQELFTTLRGDQNRTLHNLSQYLQSQMDAGNIPHRDAFDLATNLVGMLVGFAFIRPSYSDDIPTPEQAAKIIVNTFLHGICSEDK
jgi:AcrR family transcriptional regulator